MEEAQSGDSGSLAYGFFHLLVLATCSRIENGGVHVSSQAGFWKLT